MVLLAGSQYGCLVSPYSGQALTSKSNPVLFYGCSISPNATVRISACPPNAACYSSWSKTGNLLATTTSPAEATSFDSGELWYCWSVSVVIPDGYWLGVSPNNHPGQLMAVVRAVDNSSHPYYYSYRNDPQQCPAAHGTAQLGGDKCAIDPASQEGNKGWVTIYAN